MTKEYAQQLEKYLRLQTFPLGLKLLGREEQLPVKVKIPSKDLGQPVAICQALGFARKYGWTVALNGADQACPIGSVVMGWGEALPYYSEGNLAQGMYTETLEAGAKSEAAVRRFELHKYAYLVVGPLERIDFQPDIVLVYGTPAQVMRLVQGALYKQGGCITSSFSGRAECSESIVNTVITGQYQVVLPGNGERVFGQAQDEELAFAIPYGKIQDVLAGLAATHQAGVRYPIPNMLNYKPAFPAKYLKLAEMWK